MCLSVADLRGVHGICRAHCIRQVYYHLRSNKSPHIGAQTKRLTSENKLRNVLQIWHEDAGLFSFGDFFLGGGVTGVSVSFLLFIYFFPRSLWSLIIYVQCAVEFLLDLHFFLG